MTDFLAPFRRKAKTLAKSYQAGDANARAVMAAFTPRLKSLPPKHADFLFVIARQAGYLTWPEMKLAVETQGLDRAEKQTRLRRALFLGQHNVVAQLLTDTPDLAAGQFGLLCALFDLRAAEKMLQADPGLATRMITPRRPILHLAFSQHLQAAPDKQADMLALAALLSEHGADVNDGFPAEEGSSHMLSALYGAIGHAGNLPLGRWLLEQGADPNDGESLYHAAEWGNDAGVALLLEFGASPDGTNALLRAMDFHLHGGVAALIKAGATLAWDDAGANQPGHSDAPLSIPPLHHAARRHCDGAMAQLLLEGGADPDQQHNGLSAYAYARVYGNRAVARALEKAGADTRLDPQETLLAQIADGTAQPDAWLDPARLPDVYRGLLRELLPLSGTLPHIKRLVAQGLEYDRPDSEGLTPVQVAGWEGLPDAMAYFLSQLPDLSHVNGYGGTLFSTIVHGSENNPQRAQRDYVACMRLALEQSVALPRAALHLVSHPDLAEFLADWAEAHPGQVVDHGVV